MTPKFKILIAQYWTNNLSYGKFTYDLNSKYCQSKGYSYYVETNRSVITKNVEDRAFTWYKPRFILSVLEKFNPDYVLFMDADAVVCDDEYLVEEFIDANYDIIATEDHGPSKINAGVILFKNTEWVKTFLNNWWEKGNEFPNYKQGLWHDQTCFGLLMDSDSSTNNKIKIISNRELNWREPSEGNFIFHAFAYGSLLNRQIDLFYYTKNNIDISSIPEFNTLSRLASMYITDKEYIHNYFNEVYDSVFAPYRNSSSLIVEIGVDKGNSLQIWEKYFNCKVIGLDIEDHVLNQKYGNCITMRCDQGNPNDLNAIKPSLMNADIIIDDGSHDMRHQQLTFGMLFECVKPGGIYVIEDLHTSGYVKTKLEEWTHPEWGPPSRWGDPSKTITKDMLIEFKNTGKIRSDYLTSEQCKYLEDNIQDVELYDVRLGSSETSIIYKKKQAQQKVFVVYHCFLIKKWKELVTDQLTRLESSGLLAKADKIYCNVIDLNNNRQEFLDIISKYPNIEVDFHNNNDYELHGITKAWQLAQDNDCKIFYFHTKGVSNDYASVGSDVVSDLKVKSINDWRELLQYYCIDKWEENIQKLNTVDMVGVTCNNNWWWGNFWWAKSSYLKTVPKPTIRDRWGYEAWVNEKGLASIYEHHHIDFTFYFTNYPEKFYKEDQYKALKGSTITVHQALYGVNGQQIDEGCTKHEPTYVDVTDKIRANLANNNNLFINIYIDNETMQCDPVFGARKYLYIEYSFDAEPGKRYNLNAQESYTLKFPRFNLI